MHICDSMAQKVKWSFLRYSFTRSWVRISTKPFFFFIDLNFFFYLFFFFFCFLCVFFLSQERMQFSWFFKFPRQLYFYILHIYSGFTWYKMAKLVWRYSDEERGIIESVYKFCVKKKESGMKLSLDCMWERIASLTGISRSSAQRNVQEMKKAMEPKQGQKCRWVTLIRVMFGGLLSPCTLWTRLKV